MIRVEIPALPADPLGAAAAFHRDWLSDIEHRLASGTDVMVLLPPADYSHHQWRLAAIAGLARKHAPSRANMVAGEPEAAAVISTERYLAAAPGVTGQYLET